jgi:hypothetical protein
VNRQAHVANKWNDKPTTPGSERRCTGTNKHGEQCCKWALVGTDPPLCSNHLGYRQLKSFTTTGFRQNVNQFIGHMHPMYRNVLSPALRELVEQQLVLDPDEQVSILHELALMRQYVSGFVSIYSAAVEKATEDPSDTAAASRVLTSGAAMAQALGLVAELADKAAKIKVKQKDRYSLHDIRFVVDNIIVIINDVCEGDPEIAKKVGLAVQERLKIPNGYGEAATSGGTELHPADTIAAQFDAAVPYVEENE